MSLAYILERAITAVQEGRVATQYIPCRKDGELIQVRVGDHPANPARLGDNDLSIVVLDAPETCIYHVDKYRYNHKQHDYKGSGFVENFPSMQEFIEYYELTLP